MNSASASACGIGKPIFCQPRDMHLDCLVHASLHFLKGLSSRNAPRQVGCIGRVIVVRLLDHHQKPIHITYPL